MNESNDHAKYTIHGMRGMKEDSRGNTEPRKKEL